MIVDFQTLSTIGAFGIFVATAVWWLSNQFAANRKVTYDMAKSVQKNFSKKLKRHIRDDAKNFARIHDLLDRREYSPRRQAARRR